jgi:hypothetical protein
LVDKNCVKKSIIIHYYKIELLETTKKTITFDYKRKHCFRRRSALLESKKSAKEMGNRIAKHVKSSVRVLEALKTAKKQYQPMK